jgi:glycosyltransferase involved in cell wall biosynthesis
MAPRTVVLLIDELEVWGGTETHLLRLLQRLDPRRLRPVIAVVGRARLVPEFRAQGIPTQALEIHRALALEGVAGAVKIAALLRAERAGLLVTYHTAADLLGPPSGLLARVPVLSCRRDDGFTKKQVHVQLQRPLNELLRGMISVSHFVAHVVERTERFPRSRIQVIWNGEDVTRFAPGSADDAEALRAELGLGVEDCLATCVGSLTPVKDHATQLDALVSLTRSHNRLRLLVVGDGPERATLAERAAPLGDRVRFLGHRRDVPRILRGSDLYVQTSLTEGFSNAILQAMAVGLPIVATAVGGNLELVPATCGVLVPPRDPARLAAALASLVDRQDTRLELGAAARRRAEAYGTLEVMTAAYEDALERAMDGRFPGPSSGAG